MRSPLKKRLPICRYKASWPGDGLIRRMRLRVGKLRSDKKLFRAIIVEPTLSRLKTCDDRMSCGRVMFGCVLIRRAVAATDMTTFSTSPQMKPPTTLLHAFNATCAAGLRGGVKALYPVFHVYLPTRGPEPTPHLRHVDGLDRHQRCAIHVAGWVRTILELRRSRWA